MNEVEKALDELIRQATSADRVITAEDENKLIVAEETIRAALQSTRKTEWMNDTHACMNGDTEALKRTAEAMIKTPVPDDVADEEITLDDVISWADGVQGTLGTEYANKVTENEAYISDCVLRGFNNKTNQSELINSLRSENAALIRAASTPSVDTISIKREVELWEAIKILKHEIKFADDAYYPMLTVTQALEQALASLDAVLAEGE